MGSTTTVGGVAWRRQHRQFRDLAEAVGDWAGIPIPIDGFCVRMADDHPHKAAFEQILSRPEPAKPEPPVKLPDVKIRNCWWSHRLSAYVWILEHADGRIEHLIGHERFAVKRLTFWLSTMGASQAWSIDAELEARRKLAGMLKPHLYAMYEMTGSFFETSPRSGVTYLLRRARPTIAMAPTRHGDPNSQMKILAVLCMHPLAYYADTWAGAMVPTDDVIAHLTFIRGDEAGLWRHANQHRADAPEAGL